MGNRKGKGKGREGERTKGNRGPVGNFIAEGRGQRRHHRSKNGGRKTNIKGKRGKRGNLECKEREEKEPRGKVGAVRRRT